MTRGVWRQEGTTPSVSIKKNIFRRNATLTARLFFFFKVRVGSFLVLFVLLFALYVLVIVNTLDGLYNFVCIAYFHDMFVLIL